MPTYLEGKIRLRSCQRCGGDAFLDTQDGREWRCLQCARPVSFVAAAAPPVVQQPRAA